VRVELVTETTAALGLASPMWSASEVRMPSIGRHRFAAVICRAALLLAFFASGPAHGVRLLAAPGGAGQDGQPTIKFVRNPEAAPDFKLQTLDGKTLTLSSFSGKVVLLNFWATWCGPCRMEIPDLIELQKEYKDSLQIVSLLVDVDDMEYAKKFAADAGFNYPVAVAPPEVRMEYGGISALPTLFVLDPQGRIVQKHVGLSDPRLYELETRALLNLAIPFKVETFEDTGEIFLKNANRATELPGVDLTGLTAEQKIAALHSLNAESCSCGCKLTLAQCRIYDSACRTSQERAAKIVVDAAVKPPAGIAAPAQNAPSDPSGVTASPDSSP
jgi:thiol-disulfide isomerase/thioredoxin